MTTYGDEAELESPFSEAAQALGYEAGEAFDAYTAFGEHEGAGSVAAGRQVIARHAVLSRHRGTPPDLLVRWNAMPSGTSVVDVAVHLHGYSGRGARMRLTDKEPISGLDFADPTSGSPGRVAPTLTMLPRGNYFGGRSGMGYNFPELVKPGALQRLAVEGLSILGRHTGVNARLGKLILSGHSGGGAPVNQIVRHTDADEVYIFDGTYGDMSGVLAWARSRIGRGATQSALRVLYRPGSGTQANALRLASGLTPVIAASSSAESFRRAFRVEPTRVEHNNVPRVFGWRLLADASADLPGVASSPARARESEGPFDREGYMEAEDPVGSDGLDASEGFDEAFDEAYDEAGWEAFDTEDFGYVTGEHLDGAATEDESAWEAEYEMVSEDEFESAGLVGEWTENEGDSSRQWESSEYLDEALDVEALDNFGGFDSLDVEALDTEGPLAFGPETEELTATTNRLAGRVLRSAFVRCTGRAQPGAMAVARQWRALTGRRAGCYNCRPTAFGTPSLHGEGRAIDCYANASRPAEAAEAAAWAAWVTQNAVELQVAVVIWNRRIWSWSRRAQGWRAYKGNPHTDHVHVELSWEGAMHPSPLWNGPVPGMGWSAAGYNTPVHSTCRCSGSGCGGQSTPANSAPAKVPTSSPAASASTASATTGIKLSPKAFVQKYAAAARASQARSGVPALVALGQAALESGWGARAAGYNFFGIKAKASDPPTTRQLWRTREVLSRPDARGFPEVISVTPRPDGKYTYIVRDWFRAYSSPEEAFLGHGTFLRRNKRYAPAFQNTADPYRFADAVAAAGYATDPSYSRTLQGVMRLIERNGWTR